MTTHTLPLPYPRPPLNANQNHHWATKAATVKQLRRDSHLLALSGKLPRNNHHVTIQLHYQPNTNRRRDPANIWPTQKALIDGLVDYGLVPDDNQTHVQELSPHIHPVQKGQPPKLWLTITINH